MNPRPVYDCTHSGTRWHPRLPTMHSLFSWLSGFQGGNKGYQCGGDCIIRRKLAKSQTQVGGWWKWEKCMDSDFILRVESVSRLIGWWMKQRGVQLAPNA